MPEREYQLRFSGVSMFTRTSVKGCEGGGEAPEIVYLISNVVVTLERCHPHVA